jgi:hypothetical protein
MRINKANHAMSAIIVLLSCLATACGGGGDDDSAAGLLAAELRPAGTTAHAASATTAVNSSSADTASQAASLGKVVGPVYAPMPSNLVGDAVAPAQLLTNFDGTERLRLGADGQSEQLLGIRAPSTVSTAYSEDPGRLNIQYQGGDAAMRHASLSSDFDRPGNRVLHFMLREPNVVSAATGQPIKGRVQLNAYDKRALRARELYFSTRLFLHEDFESLRLLPAAIPWLTIASWWNNAGWTSQPHPFKISVNIVKPSPAVGAPLHFRVHASVKDAVRDSWNTKIWEVTNQALTVPTGRWVTLEYYFREGNAATGQFYMALTPDGGNREIVFQVNNWTHHPDDNDPDGLTHLNPVKLYTAPAVIDHVRDHDGALQMAWDDLVFTVCREHGSATAPSACALRFAAGTGPAMHASGAMPAHHAAADMPPADPGI